MGAHWPRRLTTALTLALLGAAPPVPAPADDRPPPSEPPKAATAPGAASDAAKPLSEGLDEAAARADALARLTTLPAKDDKAASPAARTLREVLVERLKWLDAYAKAVKERADAENPAAPPETLAAAMAADLERIRAALDQTARNPDVLLPSEFRNLPAQVPDEARTEMKEAIDAAQSELKETASKLEQLRASAGGAQGSALSAARSARDKAFRRVASLKARNAEWAAAAVQAKTSEARHLAAERFLNGRWEARAEEERLKAQEAVMALEARKARSSGLNVQVYEARVALATRALERMKARYQAATARQERDLHQAAVREKSRSETLDDPLERYRAKRAAELLELEARVLTSENALAANPSPSYEDQLALADHAETDFTNVRHLLDDGRVSHLDALRLNNDFRRIGAERARIVRKELVITANRLTAAANALSDVEMEIVNDARGDRFELDNLLERLPKAAHPKALALAEENERRHAALLNRYRAALEALARRAERAHDQVLRRLRILDDHFGFIRTHLFWVRDEEPVGLSTLAQAQREARQLGRAAVRLGAEAADRPAWGRVSPEFLAAIFGLVLLPWPLRRLRGALRHAAGPLLPNPGP